MVKNEYVVAIDLGTSKVATLVGRKAGDGKVEILSGAVSDSLGGVTRGEIKNTEHLSKALKATLDKVEKELNINIREAYVGLTGQHIKSSKHSGYIFIENNDNEVRKRDVQRLNDSMNNVQISVGERIVTIIPQRYSVDGEPESGEPVGVIGKKLEASFNIISGNRETMFRIDRCLAKSSINVKGHMLNPIASAEAVAVPDEKELGVAVIDLGGGTTDLCIYHDNAVRHIAIIPLGGNIINRDIRFYGILERYIEGLKVKFGAAVSKLERADKYVTIPGVNGRNSKEISFRNLAAIIEARMLDIVDAVNFEIERSGYKDKIAAGIVLTGGCAKLKNVDVFFREHTGFDVRVAAPEVNITDETKAIVSDPAFATAVGLLIQAAEDGITMNVDTTSAVNPFAKPAEKQEVENKTPEPPVRRGGRNEKPTPPEPQAAEPDDDDNENEEDSGGKKGFFGRLSDKIAGMFETIDDEI